MPKTIATLRNFAGGVNSQYNPRDIADNQFGFAQDVIGDRVGAIRTMGNGSGTPRQVDNSASAKSMNTLASTDIKGYISDATCDYNDDPTIAMDSTEKIEAGMSVSGTGIPAGATVSSVTNATSFELSANTTGGSETNETLTFTEGRANATGYGFKHFELDYDELERNTGEHYIAMVSAAGVLNVWDYTFNSWSSGMSLDLGSDTNCKPLITPINNGIRVADSELTNNSTIKYYMYVKRSQLGVSRDDFYVGSNTLSAPTTSSSQNTLVSSATYDSGQFNFTVESTSNENGTWTSADYVFGISFVYDGNQESAVSLCSDGLSKDNVNEDRALKVTIYASNTSGGTAYDARLTGARIYWKYASGLGFSVSSPAAQGEWNLLSDVDLTGSSSDNHAFGVRSKLGDKFSDWATTNAFTDATCDTTDTDATITMDSTADLLVGTGVSGTGIPADATVASITNSTTFELSANATATNSNQTLTFTNVAGTGYRANCSIVVTDPPIDTYATLNGYRSSDGALIIGNAGDGYKTAIFTNRRMFVANVKMTGADGDQVQDADRIMYSPVNKPDIFPQSQFIDVIKGDAEAYIKLEAVSDRLFAFKKDTLFIINISNPSPAGWFLEAAHKGMGVLHPAAVFKTDFGIVWANPNGLYIYQEGGGIAELTEGKILNGYGTDDYGFKSWGKLITKNSIVGYSNKDKEIIVNIDCSSTTNDTTFGGNGADVVVYDMETQSIWFGKNRLTSGAIATNFDYDWNGDLIYGSEASNTVTVRSWQSESQTSTGAFFSTKDIDFGSPSKKKKIYNIYITYKHSGSNNLGSFLSYSTNGGTGFATYDGDGSTQISNNTLDQATSWEIHKFTFTTPVECQSMALRFNAPITDGTCDTTDTDATVTMDNTGRIAVGMSVSGTGIPAGTTVSSITDGTTFELSAVATASNTNTTLTFGSSATKIDINDISIEYRELYGKVSAT